MCRATRAEGKKPCLRLPLTSSKNGRHPAKQPTQATYSARHLEEMESGLAFFQPRQSAAATGAEQSLSGQTAANTLPRETGTFEPGTRLPLAPTEQGDKNKRKSARRTALHTAGAQVNGAQRAQQAQEAQGRVRKQRKQQRLQSQKRI